MPDEQGPTNPPKPKKRPNEPVSAELYERMWEVYKKGQRTSAEIMRECLVSEPTARRAINSGWEDRGFAPLKQRAREHDKMQAEVERQRLMDQHKEATDAWYKAGKQFNRVADNAVAFSIMAMQQIVNLVVVRTPNGQQMRPLTKWVRRRVAEQGEDGRVRHRYYDEEVPLTTAEAVKLEAAVLKAAAMASAFKRMWPTQTDDQRAQQAGPPSGLAALTMEQMQHILDTGQLPPGVTAEDVFGFDVPGMAAKPPKRSN